VAMVAVVVYALIPAFTTRYLISRSIEAHGGCATLQARLTPWGWTQLYIFAPLLLFFWLPTLSSPDSLTTAWSVICGALVLLGLEAGFLFQPVHIVVDECRMEVAVRTVLGWHSFPLSEVGTVRRVVFWNALILPPILGIVLVGGRGPRPVKSFFTASTPMEGLAEVAERLEYYAALNTAQEAVDG
jgi:hypothetical protein